MFAKRVSLVAALLFPFFYSFGAANPPRTPAEQPPSTSPKDLLIQSYILGMQFSPEERAYQLVLLTEVAVKLDPTLGDLWAEEAFQSTLGLRRTHNRLAMQMNAITALSQIAPDKAWELFNTLDLPVLDESGILDEDLRAHAARVLFPTLWRLRGRAVLDELRVAAEHLGNTGQYPYEAFVPIVHDLSSADPSVANSLVGEATTYYPRAANVRHNDYEFKEFLVAVWKDSPRSVTVPALQVFARHLKEEIERPNPSSKVTYRAQAFAGGSASQFQSEAAHFLYELLPLLRTVDRDQARTVEELISAKAPSDGDNAANGRVESATIVGDATPAQQAELVQKGMEKSRLDTIQSEASTNPTEALRLASTLTNPVFRAEAFFDVAAAFGQNSPGKAKELISNAEDLEAGIKDGPGRLHALTAHAKASARLDRAGDFRETATKAFSLGEELFQEDADANPLKPALFANGYEALDQLTEIGVPYQPEFVLTRINGIQNSELKALLLIRAAQATLDASQKSSRETSHN